MVLDILRDPKIRRAYILTKVGVFAAAAVATWPLSRIIGPRAWIGLGVFGVVLLGITATLLVAATAAADNDTEEAAEDDDESGPLPPEDPIRLPIEDSIDLHSFPPADIPAVVADYLEEAQRLGMTEVRLIHGRGIGVQRERVRSLLSKHPFVDAYHDAPPGRGGWGATVVHLVD